MSSPRIKSPGKTPRNSVSDPYSSLSSIQDQEEDSEEEMESLSSRQNRRASAVADAMIDIFDKQMEIRRKSEVRFNTLKNMSRLN